MPIPLAKNVEGRILHWSVGDGFCLGWFSLTVCHTWCLMCILFNPFVFYFLLYLFGSVLLFLFLSYLPVIRSLFLLRVEISRSKALANAVFDHAPYSMWNHMDGINRRDYFQECRIGLLRYCGDWCFVFDAQMQEEGLTCARWCAR